MGSASLPEYSPKTRTFMAPYFLWPSTFYGSDNMNTQTHNLRAALIAFIAFTAFSGADTIVKTLSARIGVYGETTFLLSVFALSFIVGHGCLSGQAKRLLPVYPKLAFGRALLLSMNTLLIYYAFSALPLAEAYVLGFSSPIFVAIVAFIMVGERLSLRGWFGVLLGFAGVIWILQPGAAPLSAGHLAAFGFGTVFRHCAGFAAPCQKR